MMVMVDVNNSSPRWTRTKVSWLGLRVGSLPAMFYNYQMNRINSCNNSVVTSISIPYLVKAVS